MNLRAALSFTATALLTLSLTACGGGGGGGAPTLHGATGYTIGGTVSGLSGRQVTLLNNGSDALTVTANGSFTFATPVAYNGSYAVTVGTQPTGQTCTVSHGSGAGVIANVSNVSITCSTNTYTIVGTVLGLASGTQVTLNNNGADPTTVTANGSFTFATPVAYNGSYAATVGTQPTGETCSVSHGSGAGVTASVSNVAVTCADTQFVYVANRDSNTVSAYRIDATTGALTPVAGSPFAAGGAPVSVTVNPTSTFAYVANSGSNTVSAYRIDAATGALTPVAGSPFATGGSTPASVTVPPTGTFAYVANTYSNNVSAYSINATTGALTPVAGSPFTSAYMMYPVSVATSAAGNPGGNFFLFAADNRSDTISVFTINTTTGALTSDGDVFGNPGEGPISVAVDPNFFPCNATTCFPYGYFYEVNQNDYNVLEQNFSVFTGAVVGGNGTTPTGSFPYAITLNRAGTFAYVANSGSNTVSAYSIDAPTGGLTEVAGSPFATGVAPLSVAVNPAGTFAYVANSGSSTVSAYSINAATGALTPVAGSPFAAGITPFSVVVAQP